MFKVNMAVKLHNVIYHLNMCYMFVYLGALVAFFVTSTGITVVCPRFSQWVNFSVTFHVTTVLHSNHCEKYKNAFQDFHIIIKLYILIYSLFE